VIPLSNNRLWLLSIAREAGDRFFNPTTRRCLIARDTCWYAISLLFDDAADRRALGSQLLASLKSEDATHTPATLLALFHRIPDKLSSEVSDHLDEEVKNSLVESADIEWRDGNVNHPLAAYCTLVLGGERYGQDWAVRLGHRRLKTFQERIGGHRSRYRRQAEMSEYNSLTYTALDLWFLCLMAEHSRTDDVRTLALFLEGRLWVDVAMHFHAPSQQFAGPHSRSYQDDSVGGFSALHCTMFAAFEEPLFMHPDLAYRYNHPSNLVQNALVALLPYHVPELARRIAWEKPFPYSFQKTTYGESYHENSRRWTPTAIRDVCARLNGGVGEVVDVAPPAGTPFAFDDERYPGGWSDLTSYLTEEYALGSAALPYVNAGHADSVTLRIRRSASIRSMNDIRSAYTRGVFNNARVGEKNFSHVAQSAIDESYLYEEGRCATYQHKNRVIVCYSPKRAGHLGVRSFRLDLIFSYFTPLDSLVIDGRSVEKFPVRCSGSSRLCFRDYRTYGLVIPLHPVPASSGHPILLWRCGDFLVLSMYNYEGEPRDISRHEINGWRTGFVMELSCAMEMSWEDFLRRASTAHLAETMEGGIVRNVCYESAGDIMEFSYDPYKEVILSRQWNGENDCVDHFFVEAGGKHEGLFCPPTIFGEEVMP
jgi:hypothetical protein